MTDKDPSTWEFRDAAVSLGCAIGVSLVWGLVAWLVPAHDILAGAVGLTITLLGGLGYWRIKALIRAQLDQAMRESHERQVELVRQSQREVSESLTNEFLTYVKPEPLTSFLMNLQHRAMAKQRESDKRHNSTRNLLLTYAPKFLADEGMQHGNIVALCSKKGEHGTMYYKKQLEWAKVKKRSLKRVFIKEGGGFSEADEAGIMQHWNSMARRDGRVEIRWIARDAEVLKRVPSGYGWVWFSLGKAIVHDADYGGVISPQDRGGNIELEILKLILSDIFDQALQFDDDEISRLRRNLKQSAT